MRRNVSKAIDDACEFVRNADTLELREVPVDSVIDVQTRSGSVYRFEFDTPKKRDTAREAMVSGGALITRYPGAIRVWITGSTFGHGGMLRVGGIVRGMSIEMYRADDGGKGFATSSVQSWEIRRWGGIEPEPASSAVIKGSDDPSVG